MLTKKPLWFQDGGEREPLMRNGEPVYRVCVNGKFAGEAHFDGGHWHLGMLRAKTWEELEESMCSSEISPHEAEELLDVLGGGLLSSAYVAAMMHKLRNIAMKENKQSEE